MQTLVWDLPCAAESLLFVWEDLQAGDFRWIFP